MSIGWASRARKRNSERRKLDAVAIHFSARTRLRMKLDGGLWSANRVDFEVHEKGGPRILGPFICGSPFGEMLAEAGDSKEEILVVECDPAKSEDTRRNWPFCATAASTLINQYCKDGWTNERDESENATPHFRWAIECRREMDPHAATWLAWPHELTDGRKILADSVGVCGYCAAPRKS